MRTLLNKKTIFISLLALLLVGLGYKFNKSQSFSKKLGAVGKVTKGDLVQRVTIAGQVVPNKKSIITAPYSGYVQKLFVRVGDKVTAGSPLVSVNQSLQSTDASFPLRAPFNGTVVQMGKTEGEFVKEGDSKDFILRLDDLTKLFIVALSPEIDRVKVKLGQEGIIKASALLDKKYKGVIRELANAAREKEEWGGRSQVAEFGVRIEILDADAELKPGMSVVIDIITHKKEGVLMLRHEFIHREGENYYAVLKTGERRNIKVGVQNEEAFEIIEGLKENDSIEQVDFSKIEHSK